MQSAEQQSIAAALRSLRLAMRFRRETNRALKVLGISFAQWRALEAAWRLIERTHDAVSHLDVSRELELDEASVSRLMHVLSRHAWVSHGPDPRHFGWRVVLTDDGEKLVAAAYSVIAATLKD